MPRVARASVRRIASFPWYEWVDEYEWDDDEFEGPVLSNRNKCSQLGSCYDSFVSRFGGLETKEGDDEIGIV